ncbi:MAG: hypothetical protein A2487_09240 [Candidatus Raymondbacteria bacterium RifOxyC12_full_50_8]|uniref:Uncharacterized protein n=1 Tax=Candidatus Raymondbacteria bacterium RIFOXYD12_FULL_49_13 TaxID=1817890 RepID=A0A1F7FFU8_UNCRA|nr:MAG: hypothetical protein A2248_22700 [Candidatus Raymondbacteria bacterium RIFOXYA2_FULL_49_16]OGJ94602.1 MAG: hypothetical protein A2350_05970 [Candidatus Raymondbacteria bacterium RifOxyB12_full_50_8]OGJ98872.1 MAG: hypothetical protein A2487_09240 [Candidatus Raymondbacteria bacterium RifOxyC12_full_50_8]OGK05377.1 MAG: hypothetical protein A2519_03650 [Candidatus Raymondbacteria bacterium RIFOXYD12_FULL_49_13]OGP42990.1 MAG: hypothetical protein A2324_16355 [Candidatus Raymondbacteria b
MKDFRIGPAKSTGTLLAVGIFGTLKIDQPYDNDMLNFYSGVYGRETKITEMPCPTRHLTYEYNMNNCYKLSPCGQANMKSSRPGS